MYSKRILALAALGVAASWASAAEAATYTVSTSGSDSNDGISAPFRTLQKAERVLQAGDTILLQAGTYVAGAYIEEANITVRGVGEVVLDGTNAAVTDGLSFTQTSGITVENVKIRNCRRMGLFVTLSRGLTVRGCEFGNNAGSGLLTGNTSDVKIENCQALRNTGHGIYLSQSGDRLQVLGCLLSGNQRTGIQINAVQGGVTSDPSSDGLSDDCVVAGNTVSGNGQLGGSAIQFMGVRRSVVVNNLLHGNLAGGISLWNDGAGAAFGSKDNRIFHNTVVFDSGVGRYGLQVAAGSTGNTLRNNILGGGNGPALEASEPVDSNFNLFTGTNSVNGGGLSAWQSSSGNDLNSRQGSASLGADFHAAAGSVAIDAGTLVWETDRDGRPRPSGSNPDLGCFEEGGVVVVDPDPAPTPVPTAAVIYGDALASGWRASSSRANYSLAVTSPVAEGSRSMSITITGRDGYVRIQGTGISLSGKSVLRFKLHGGGVGGQQLRIRSIVNGVQQSNSLNLMNYGGLPKAGQWIECSVPLADLKATAGSLTGLTFFAGNAQAKVFIDSLRME